MSAGDAVGRAEQLEREVASLQRRLDRSMGEIERLEQEIARMQKLLEEAVRKKKRNTAPFSRDNPKPNPKTAGRKSGRMRTLRQPAPSRLPGRTAVRGARLYEGRCPGQDVPGRRGRPVGGTRDPHRSE